MALRQICPFCGAETLARRMVAFYVGKAGQIKMWECRKCKGAWSSETSLDTVIEPLGN
tara:strand:- start:6888 stop:7061 length:174 start_codon:yes stop_codon:yes gene_type:complete